MSVHAKRGAAVFVVLSLLACGGAGKQTPMVADPAAASTEEPSGFEGFGAQPTGEGDAGAEAQPGPAPATAAAVASEDPAKAASPQGNEEGARTLLRQFVVPNADHAALTRSLRPSSSDYKALFDAATAGKVEGALAKEWDSGKAVIKPKAGQTEVKLWSATSAELASGKGAAKDFPGGYKKVSKHLAPGVVFFRFKFVEAGKDAGTAYDGLAFVNGHWVIAPKPWRAMEGKGGADDDKNDTAPPSKHGGKKHGKKKK